jgi:hypothetical protein
MYTFAMLCYRLMQLAVKRMGNEEFHWRGGHFFVATHPVSAKGDGSDTDRDEVSSKVEAEQRKAA